MRGLTCCLIAFVFSASLVPLWAAPQMDMSVAAYKRATDAAEKRATATTEKEFAEDTQNVDLLSKPFKLRETITVTRTIGGNITGTLYGVQGDAEPMVMIGDRRINLSDLTEVDQQRLRLGQKPPEEAQKLAKKMRQELDDKKAKRVQFLTKRNLEALGYTDAFFLSTVVLSDTFWRLSDLGHKRVLVTLSTGSLEEDPSEAFYYVTVTNLIKDDTAVVATWNNKPLAILGTESALKEQAWKKLRLALPRTTFGADPAGAVTSNLRLVVYKSRVGRWELDVVRTGGRSKDSSIMAEYECTMDAKRAKDFQPEMAAEYATAATAALAAMAETKEALEKGLKDAQQNEAQIQELKRKRAEEEKRKEEQAEKLANLEENLKKMEKDWHEHGAVLPAGEEINTALVVRRGQTFGNVNSPTRIDDYDVVRFSKWTVIDAPMVRDEAQQIKLSGYHYRFIRCAREGDDPTPVYYLQMYIWCQNRAENALTVSPQLTFTFTNGDKVLMDSGYPVPGGWSGYIVGAKTISIDLVLQGIKSLQVALPGPESKDKAKETAPEAKGPAVKDGEKEPVKDAAKEPAAGDAPKDGDKDAAKDNVKAATKDGDKEPAKDAAKDAAQETAKEGAKGSAPAPAKDAAK